MTEPSSTGSRPPRRWLTWRKVVCAGLLFLLAGYIYARPELQDWIGTSLPKIAQSPLEQDTGDTAANQNGRGPAKANGSAGGHFLNPIGPQRYASPAGLTYAPAGRGQHRIQHVMRHRNDDPQWPIHGVFEGSPEEVLRLIDRAFELARADAVPVQIEREGERDAYTIDLQRRIGYVGGEQGQQRGYPECQRWRLVLQGREVITAYPVQ